MVRPLVILTFIRVSILKNVLQRPLPVLLLSPEDEVKNISDTKQQQIND